MRASVEQTVVERVEDGDKREKKSRRRSNRRSKQSGAAAEGACSSVNECSGSASMSLSKRHPSTVHHSLPKPGGLETHASIEQELARESKVPFNSMPTLHINSETDPEEVDLHSVASNPGGRMFSKSYRQPTSCRGSSETSPSKDSCPSYPTLGYDRSKFFSPHWPLELVDEALEKGDVFRALFHVNAHNRQEAYCKIDGVQTDVLINGIAAQNRAVEGDIVAIKIDPLPFWTKMRGSCGSSNSSSITEDGNIVQDGCRGEKQIEIESKFNYDGEPVLSGNDRGDCSTSGRSAQWQSVGLESTADNGYQPSASSRLVVGSSSERNEVDDAIGKISALINSYPSKRPTGMVVSIIEHSPRRDVIVGFLNVRQLFIFKEVCRKNIKKNKNSSIFLENEFIQLTPTDARFPKMMVLAKDLPDGIKKRLINCDTTVEMELVAAKIDGWYEESQFPHARVLHIFGRGGEMKAQIDAILFENTVNCSDFSAESISCLPRVPWDVPQLEFQSRNDLRNQCIFTIDPSTATELDDALSVEVLPKGTYRVGVHIADVSYFVRPDTPLDSEAQTRSTSVYMLHRKLSMLPPLLSETLGSLNPGVDRLAFSIFWDISSSGTVVDHWIGRSVIRSCCKLSYEQAQDIIDGNVELETMNGLPEMHGPCEWSDVIRSIKILNEISGILKQNRLRGGALPLENSKVVFLLDEYGIPYDSLLCQRKQSNFVVEELMLLANRTVAEVISRAFPDTALLRRHPEPNMRKLREFEAFCSKHGLVLDASSSCQFYKSLERIRETLKDDSVLFDILISYATRPMQLASYFCTGELKDRECDWGHYALALPLYTHFTSPLRRYPDIVVHRMLAAAIEAEQLYLKKKVVQGMKQGDAMTQCFTGICFDKKAAESREGMEVLSAAAMKHGVPGRELLADVAAYCNQRKLASRHVKDAIHKLYMWVLLKKKQIMTLEARVLSLGPRFMSVYIPKLAIERRIYYDEVDELVVEWLENTSTLLLSLSPRKCLTRRGSSNRYRALDDAAFFMSPYGPQVDCGGSAVGENDSAAAGMDNLRIIPRSSSQDIEVDPLVFPITVRLLSTIPVALHAIGGDDGPIDIGVRLYATSYFR